MRGIPILIAVAILVAGCSGFTGGEDPTPTLTPATAPETVAYPPGVDASGVVSPATLADAHSERDDNRSYTLVSNRTVTFRNGTVRSQLLVRLALAENRSYLATISTAGPHGPVLLGIPPAAAVYWSNGTTYARKYTRDGETTYNTFSPPDQYTGTWQFWTQTVAFGGRSGYAGKAIRATFDSIPTTLADRDDRNGTTFYRLTGDEAIATDFAAPEIDTVGNLTFEATVDGDGLVHSMTYRFDGTIDGQPVVVERAIRYERVGKTSVGAPSWVPRATRSDQ